MFFPFPHALTRGRFLRRLNRFVAEVELDGKPTRVHVPNTGRMTELLVAGRDVCLVPVDSPTRKTSYDLMLVRYGKTWVCVDSRQANEVAWHILKHLAEGKGHGLPEPGHPLWELFSGITHVAREVVRSGHRFDFHLQRRGRAVWVEVKSVNLVIDGVALFPDAPTERGTDHVRMLAQLADDGDQAHVLFIVQRDDARAFAPHAATDPAFAQALAEAAGRGVHVHALGLRLAPEGAYLQDVLPVQM